MVVGLEVSGGFEEVRENFITEYVDGHTDQDRPERSADEHVKHNLLSRTSGTHCKQSSSDWSKYYWCQQGNTHQSITLPDLIQFLHTLRVSFRLSYFMENTRLDPRSKKSK